MTRLFGCRIETGLASYEDASRQAKLADRLGFDSLWIRDHVAVPEITGDPNCLELFVTLAGFARDTERIKLGSLVVCTPWRNPALVAKMAATIDVMSGGRLILGLGAAAPGLGREFERYGFPFESQGARTRALGEQIQIMKKMWTEDSPSFEGRYHTIKDAVCEPFPIQKPHPPIMIGASGEQLALKNVAKYADWWETGSDVPLYQHKAGVLAEYCEEYGRDPATISHAVHRMVVMGPRGSAAAKLESLLAEKPGLGRALRGAISGEPEIVAEQIGTYYDAGVTTFIAFFYDHSAAAQEESIQMFAEEVMPILK